MKRLRRQGYSLATVCDFIGISPQAYHKRLKQDKVKGTLYQSLYAQVMPKTALRTAFLKGQTGLLRMNI